MASIKRRARFSTTLQAGIVAWLGVCCGAIGAYLVSLDSWSDWSSLHVAAGAFGQGATGLVSLAAYLRNKAKAEAEAKDAVDGLDIIDLGVVK